MCAESPSKPIYRDRLGMAAREVRFGWSEPTQGTEPVLLCNCGGTDIVRALASALAYSFAVVDVRELPLGERGAPAMAVCLG